MSLRMRQSLLRMQKRSADRQSCQLIELKSYITYIKELPEMHRFYISMQCPFNGIEFT